MGMIMWRLWAKAIGEKAHKKDNIADKVAIIRTFIFATYLLTNCFIVAGVIRHWNDETVVNVELFYEKPTMPIHNVIMNRPGEFE